MLGVMLDDWLQFMNIQYVLVYTQDLLLHMQLVGL